MKTAIGWRAGILLGLASLLAACAASPGGEYDFFVMPEDEEIHMGSEAHDDIVRKYGRYKNQELQSYVEYVGNRLALNGQRHDIRYQFTVLDSPEINAFSLPGGYVYITRGLLAHLNSEAELAAILGHEIGHVEARHAMRQIKIANTTQLALSGDVDEVIELQGGVASHLLNVLRQELHSGYGREHELQAVRFGSEYLARAGYEPRAMLMAMASLKNVDLFESALAEREGREYNGGYHGNFGSHPKDDSRLLQVVAAANQYRDSGNAKFNYESFLQRIDGLVYGDSEQNGIRRGSSYYHAGLNLGIDFPAGWAVETTNQSITSMPGDNSAQLVMTVEHITARLHPEQYLYARLKVDTLDEDYDFSRNGVEGYTGIGNIKTAVGERRARMAVIHYEGRAYILIGFSRRQGELSKYDGGFRRAVESFRKLSEQEAGLAQSLHVKVVQPQGRVSMAALAATSRFPIYPEARLRLLNGLSLRGEPVAGQPIKIVQ